MAEWFKAHAWKACLGKLFGSNPTLSAIFLMFYYLPNESIIFLSAWSALTMKKFYYYLYILES